MDNPWAMLYNMQNEQNILREKYDNLLDIVEKLLAALSESELKRIESKKLKKSMKCKYFNRGYCKEGSSCDFVHPQSICKEFVDVGTCESGQRCHRRHPRKCRYWREGNCWRGSSCAFQHQEKDRLMENEEHEHENEECEAKNDKNQGSAADSSHEASSSNLESVDDEEQSISAEEIINMYENADKEALDSEVFTLDDGDDIFDIDEIEKVLACSEYLSQNQANVNLKVKSFGLKKSTRRKSTNRK